MHVIREADLDLCLRPRKSKGDLLAAAVLYDPKKEELVDDGNPGDSTADKFQMLLAAINSLKKSMEQQMVEQLANFKEVSHEEATEKQVKRWSRE